MYNIPFVYNHNFPRRRNGANPNNRAILRLKEAFKNEAFLQLYLVGFFENLSDYNNPLESNEKIKTSSSLGLP